MLCQPHTQAQRYYDGVIHRNTPPTKTGGGVLCVFICDVCVCDTRCRGTACSSVQLRPHLPDSAAPLSAGSLSPLLAASVTPDPRYAHQNISPAATQDAYYFSRLHLWWAEDSEIVYFFLSYRSWGNSNNVKIRLVSECMCDSRPGAGGLQAVVTAVCISVVGGHWEQCHQCNTTHLVSLFMQVSISWRTFVECTARSYMCWWEGTCIHVHKEG